MRKTILCCTILIFSFLIPLSVFGAEASFYLSPAKGTYAVGERFYVNVMINTDGAAINAGQAEIYFSSDKLKVTGISKNESIFHLWPEEPVYSNSQGKITFGGGLPTPGYTGEAGKIFAIIFQGINTGEAKVSFGKEMILANDSRGTNIFGSSKEGIYNIIVSEGPPPEVVEKLPPLPKVYSPTHPRPERWYSNNSPKLQWDLPPDVTDVSTAFNQEFIFAVPSISEGLFSSKTFSDVEDGIWYFHIKFKNKAGWGGISRFRVQIDTQPPHPFDIKVDNEGDETNPQPLLYFETKDDTSGINHYEVKIGEGDILSLLENQVNPFRMPHQNPGMRPVIVKAVDNAGNITTSTTNVEVKSIPSPELTICPNVFVSGEEVLYLEGTAPVRMKVIVFLTRDGKTVKIWEVVSDDKGNWVLKDDGLFRSGVYIISARTKDSREAISNPSEECVIKFIFSGFALGPWIIAYRWLTWLMLLLLLILLAILIYIFWRLGKSRRQIERESKDLKEKFYKEYNELHADVMQQLEAFRKAKENRELTDKEKYLEKRLLKNLKDVEEVIRKEIRDIEDIDLR